MAHSGPMMRFVKYPQKAVHDVLVGQVGHGLHQNEATDKARRVK